MDRSSEKLTSSHTYFESAQGNTTTISTKKSVGVNFAIEESAFDNHYTLARRYLNVDYGSSSYSSQLSKDVCLTSDVSFVASYFNNSKQLQNTLRNAIRHR